MIQQRGSVPSLGEKADMADAPRKHGAGIVNIILVGSTSTSPTKY